MPALPTYGNYVCVYVCICHIFLSVSYFALRLRLGSGFSTFTEHNSHRHSLTAACMLVDANTFPLACYQTWIKRETHIVFELTRIEVISCFPRCYSNITSGLYFVGPYTGCMQDDYIDPKTPSTCTLSLTTELEWQLTYCPISYFTSICFFSFVLTYIHIKILFSLCK